ncbi:MAG: ParB/RepB/Spo0J family partition protein [Legionellaceae bacterium]|nr:ParB/RepB/Spo0J family partition protein [Legionellaceae bacterium]
MSAKRAGLGRNLSALLKPADEHLNATAKPEEGQALKMLPIEGLQPGMYQPRTEMDETALQALAASIEQQGVLQPIVVRQLKASEQYEIIAGERRFRASKMAGLTEVPVVVRDVNDETAMALALIENLQREALNVMDEARAMHRLNQEFALTHQEIAHVLSKSRTAVSNCLRLLQLAPPVMTLLESGKLDMGHARCLLKLDAEEQVRVAHLIASQDLSVREVEALVARLKMAESVEKSTRSQTEVPAGFHDLLKEVSAHLGASVRLKPSASGRGRLLIDFKDTEQLKTLLNLLKPEAMDVVM